MPPLIDPELPWQAMVRVVAASVGAWVILLGLAGIAFFA